MTIYYMVWQFYLFLLGFYQNLNIIYSFKHLFVLINIARLRFIFLVWQRFTKMLFRFLNSGFLVTTKLSPLWFYLTKLFFAFE